MDTIQAFASAAGGVLCIFVLVRFLPLIATLIQYVSLHAAKHLTYPYVLHRHRILGPWSRAGIAVQLIYAAVNLFCLIFTISEARLRAVTVSKAGLRAGTLALVNMIPLFASPHLDLLADQLGISLKTVRRLHRSAGFMTVALGVFHVVVIATSRVSFPLHVAHNLFAVIVSVHPRPMIYR